MMILIGVCCTFSVSKGTMLYQGGRETPFINKLVLFSSRMLLTTVRLHSKYQRPISGHCVSGLLREWPRFQMGRRY